MCKLGADFGNCDEETKDQEYCIFHKPNKSEEEAKEFWRKFLERFKPKELEIPEELATIDTETLKGFEIKKRKILIFNNIVDCKGFMFPNFDFLNCAILIFEEFADFSEAIFECDVSFNLVEFGTVRFNKAIFKKCAEFLGATFKNAEFRKTRFEGSVDFRYANFSHVDFTNATFKGEDNMFYYAEIDQAYFGEAEFDGFTWFDGIKCGHAIFNLTKFGKYTNFSFAKFIGDVEFAYAIFRGLVEFIGTEFRRNVSFERAEFLGGVSFKYERNKGHAKFLGELSFLDTNFKKGIDIDLSKESFKLPEAEAEACRVQRLCYEKEGNKDKADEMFVRERRALRRAKIKQAKKRLSESNGIKKLKAILDNLKTYGSSFMEFMLADLTCEYGTNWKRPIILWIFMVLFFFPALYTVTKSVYKVHNFMSCLYFSIATATTLGYGDLHPAVGWGRALASFEAIFGTFMWAVFLVVFARKYMR